MVMRPYIIHIALFLLLAIIWSSSFTAIKVAVVEIPPLTLVTVRLVIAGILLYAVLRFKGKRLPAMGGHWIALFMLGLTSNTIPFFLISWGEVGINSGAAAILMAVMPLATVALAHFFTDNDRMTLIKFIGLMVGFSGVVILVGPESVKQLGGKIIFEMSVAGGALFYAISAVMTRRLPSGGDSLQRGTAVTICAATQMLPLSLLLDSPWVLSPSSTSIYSSIYLGVFPTAVAVLIYFHLIQERGTTFFAGINYIIPCLGVLWGFLFLGEDVSLQAIGALVIILSGVFITNLRLAGQR